VVDQGDKVGYKVITVGKCGKVVDNRPLLGITACSSENIHIQ